MPVRGGRLAACLALLLAGAGPAAAAPLSSVEEKALQRCEAVFAPGPARLDPTQASVCLKVLARLGTIGGQMADERLDPEARKRVDKVIMGASALKDLGDVFTLQAASGSLKMALSGRTFCKGPLLALGLGPSPKLLQDWAARYRPAQAPLLELVMRGWCWDAFPEVLRKRLLEEIPGGTGADWDGLCLERRYSPLFRAAKLAAADILAVPAAALNDEALPQMRQAAAVLRPYLEDGKRAELEEHLSRVERFLALRRRTAGAGGLSGGVKDQARLDEYARRLKAGELSLSEHMRFLDAIYGEDQGKGDVSGSYEGSGNGRPSAEGYEAKLAALLVPALLDEIRGTRSGDRVLAFFDDERYPAQRRKLDLRVGALDHNLGTYCNGVITVGREEVESWMLRNGVTDPAMIVKDPGLLRRLARYLAPTFVHEAAHQEQQAWLEKNGLANRYYVEREVEAWGVGSAYILEKDLQLSGRGDDSYLRSINPLLVDRARRFYEDGVTGLRRSVAPAYSSIASFDTYAAEDFELAAAVQQELDQRARDPKDAEEDLWRAPDFSSVVSLVGRINEVPDLKTSKLRQLMKENFSDYRRLSARLDEADAWVEAGLKQIKAREAGK